MFVVRLSSFQSPAKGCHCKPLFKKLESELKATQKEMRLQILNVQERVNNRLKQIDHSNRHQVCFFARFNIPSLCQPVLK